MGVRRSLQSGGAWLSFLANILTVLSTATNYWTRHHGGHSGLWQECNQGICSNMPCQTTLAVTGACMLLAAGFGIVGLVMGLRIRCHKGESLRGQTTSALHFLCDPAETPLEPQTPVPGACLAICHRTHPPSAPPPGLCFLLADMIVQSTDAISGFPVCL
ncbi:claudin domain-containing protein 2 isoform X1 [Microcebus murinus]|uniref:claudin domain-containing protein 2 isoform X1 n=1 Tax=Microcebus murinus TaxID=30608 RepID=UPI003F6A820F